ncbi:MAG: TadE/TadG family type IV pilus assembly protein [Clostridium sp.]|nr:TadE/TadG family type IV pilus assembly protein [Clostridium sp.]
MKKIRGAITVETALVLPIFIIVLISLVGYIKVLLLYDRVETGLNNSVKIVAKYSYLAKSTGVNDLGKKLNQNPKEVMDNWLDVTGIFGGEEVNSWQDAVQNIDLESVENLKNLFEEEEFKEASITLIAVFINQGILGNINDDDSNGFNNLLKAGLEAMAKNSIENSVTNGNKSKLDDVMKIYGVKKNGDKYFSFDGTECFITKENQEENIMTVQVSYECHFDILGVPVDIPIEQRVSIAPWLGE